jgi:hypothetical protein
MDKPNEMRLPDSEQEKGLSESQPDATTVSTGAGTPIGERAPSTPNDKG